MSQLWRFFGPRALGIAIAIIADRCFGDPQRGHPVSVFGKLAAVAEARLNSSPNSRNSRMRGVLYTAALVGGATAIAAQIENRCRRSPLGATAYTSVVVWSCLGGSTLLKVAEGQHRLLAAGDISGSREMLPWLCGRNPESMNSTELARAVIESVAENTSDAAVGTLVWAAMCGPAGAVLHRTANTLDAMVGHRNLRYEKFGWASARLDDLLGWPGARLTGVFTVLFAPSIGGSPRAALRAWRKDSPAHPSPNAGVAEASCAGALGLTLGGRTPYSYGVQMRPELGTGRAPEVDDILRTVRLESAVQYAAAVLAIITSGILYPRRSPRRWARRRSASKRSP